MHQPLSAARQFAVVLLEPPGYAHTGIVAEVAETIHHGLEALGAASTLARNAMWSDRVNIVFGAHLLPAMSGWDAHGTDHLVVFNLEPIQDGFLEALPPYLQLLRSCRVWDYDARNVRRLAALGISGVDHVRIGYAPPMTRIANAARQPIDVLFYGMLNQRRLRLRDQLVRMGLETRFVFGVYGAERDALVAQAKVVVSPSRFERDGTFDIVRLSYLLANHKAVVMEGGIDAEQEALFAEGVAFAGFDGLATECARLCKVEAERVELERRGFALFSATPQSAFLQPAVENLAHAG